MYNLDTAAYHWYYNDFIPKDFMFTGPDIQKS